MNLIRRYGNNIIDLTKIVRMNVYKQKHANELSRIYFVLPSDKNVLENHNTVRVDFDDVKKFEDEINCIKKSLNFYYHMNKIENYRK
jgi:hypothetical protein